MTDAPKITHVAIKYEDKVYALPAPARHHDVIREVARLNGVGISGPDVQGFIDENDKFLTRREAFIAAKQSGQLARRPGGYNGDELFSEDLW